LVTVVLVGVALVSTAIITGPLPALVFAAVLSVAVLVTIVSVKTGLSKSKTGMILIYVLWMLVYVATLGLLAYAGYVLAERLNLPKPVLTALAVVAVAVVALVVVRGAVELRKLEEFLEERGYR
jgi:energy-converting hydrogenase Eha subunit G